jgi:hypothetical protein
MTRSPCRPRRLLFSLLCLIGPAVTARAAAPLFPSPFHVTREVDDPVTGKTSRSDEYYAGGRVVTVVGSHTVIADYDKAELTEIDRAGATFSVTSFERIAASRKGRSVKLATPGLRPAVEQRSAERRLDRDVDLFVATDKAASLDAEIAVDRTMTLTREAFDIVVHAAHPDQGGPAADLVRLASRRAGVQAASAGARLPAQAGETYGLPIEQTLRWSVSGRTMVMKNRIVHVDNATAPPEVSSIPPGAQRVESRRLRTARASADLDSLRPPSSPASESRP